MTVCFGIGTQLDIGADDTQVGTDASVGYQIGEITGEFTTETDGAQALENGRDTV